MKVLEVYYGPVAMDKWTHCLALMNVNCCCLCHCVPSVMPDRYTCTVGLTLCSKLTHGQWFVLSSNDIVQHTQEVLTASLTPPHADYLVVTQTTMDLNERLGNACLDGDLHEVKLTISLGAEIDASNSYGPWLYCPPLGCRVSWLMLC